MYDHLIQPEDYHKRIEVPDKDFSPARNKAIINETIKEAEKVYLDHQRALSDRTMNGLDMFTSYGVYRFNKGTKSFSDYVGRKIKNELIGDKIMSKIRLLDTTDRLSKI